MEQLSSYEKVHEELAIMEILDPYPPRTLPCNNSAERVRKACKAVGVDIVNLGQTAYYYLRLTVIKKGRRG